jgi:EpsI family protein
VTVNRYLIQNGTSRAIVLYWYQGRGRVAASEYAVKWDLLRDAALRGRTEEALVRVAVPVDGDENAEAAAFDLAARVAGSVIPSVFLALPEA